MGHTIQRECTRCGTCCAKGGPALHREDLSRLEKGAFGRKDLMTFRRGELVRDQISGELMPLEQEIVKLRGRDTNTWTCRFLNIVDHLCFIYNDRPVECRALDCWNPEEISAMYDKDRITRMDVVGDESGVAELIRVHEEKCGYAQLERHSAAFDADPAAREAFAEAVRFDMAFRAVVCEKAGIPAEELEFYFGRTLADTAHMFGLKVTVTEEGPVVERENASAAA
ncbi:YkgJ family cysteine cluster protein [Desulfovibrio mangrovi]|uniref:YkgJ family cysteine cluster protein n=1 Tax=Desulfovibrio mangrovi TaxID=2976983 RepID=UPI0022482DBA|nr:YkgJ family cysteine cluster protein [Desulfovibrio mangrovi]UZP66128.1 YkgJ family cysteine cluster protein [Desulfovibrio mangrovi]